MKKLWMVERMRRLDMPEMGSFVTAIRSLSPTRQRADMAAACDLALETTSEGRNPGEWAHEPVHLYRIEVEDALFEDVTRKIKERRGR